MSETNEIRELKIEALRLRARNNEMLDLLRTLTGDRPSLSRQHLAAAARHLISKIEAHGHAED